MIDFLIDLGVVSILIIVITALNGVIANSIGEALFSGKKRSQFVKQSKGVQAGWRNVGGKK
jgi:hypothetical protein